MRKNEYFEIALFLKFQMPPFLKMFDGKSSHPIGLMSLAIETNRFKFQKNFFHQLRKD